MKWRKWCGYILITLVALGFFIFVWQLPSCIYSDVSNVQQHSTLVNQYRSTLFSGIGTIATVIGGIFLFLNYQHNAQRLQLDKQSNHQRYQIESSRLTLEQFNQAVENLACDNAYIQISSVLLLEQLSTKISKDIEGWSVSKQAILILSEFVRERCFTLKSRRLNSELEKATNVTNVIKAALTTLKELQRLEKSEDFIDLRGVDFSNSNLQSFALESFDLSGANFEGAQLQHCKFEKSKFVNAIFSRANLLAVDMREVDMTGAICEDSVFDNADLSGSDLRAGRYTASSFQSTNLTGSVLYNSNLGKANLSKARLQRANLNESDLEGANLIMANLEHADLKKTIFKGANLTGANLTQANMTGADMTGADLSNSILVRTILESSGLSLTQVEKALVCQVILPASISIDRDRDCQKVEKQGVAE